MMMFIMVDACMMFVIAPFFFSNIRLKDILSSLLVLFALKEKRKIFLMFNLIHSIGFRLIQPQVAWH
jgi:hypothetical protein